MALLAVPAIAEYYEIVSKQERGNRLGQNLWLCTMIVIVEFVMVHSFRTTEYGVFVEVVLVLHLLFVEFVMVHSLPTHCRIRYGTAPTGVFVGFVVVRCGAFVIKIRAIDD